MVSTDSGLVLKGLASVCHIFAAIFSDTHPRIGIFILSTKKEARIILELNERHHAFISASFYQELKEKCPRVGNDIFVMATQRYGEQRGNRMAQRVLRDGKKLDFAAYLAYGEWSHTEKYFAAQNHTKIVSKSPDYRFVIYECPWQQQYKKMGLIDGACLYCQHIDLAIARGFNPYLTFQVKSTMHKQGKCEFVMKDAYIEEKGYAVDESRAKLPFDYHCGHVYWTFSALVKSILGETGEKICANVNERFAREYGEDMLQLLLSYQDTDFNLIPPLTDR